MLPENARTGSIQRPKPKTADSINNVKSDV